MPEIRTDIHIQATAEEVWQVLCCDTARMATLNPDILEIRGALREGSTLRLRIRFAWGLSWRGKANVLQVDPPRLLRWRGGLPVRGLFYGDHTFEIADDPRGGVTLMQKERFTGILAPLALATLLKNTPAGYALANQRVKELVEKRETGATP